MALYDASGTASGSSTASGSVTVNFNLSGTASGSASGAGTAAINYLLGGQAQGSSFALFDNVQDAGGTALGTSTATVLSTEAILNASGRAYGSSHAVLSTPFPALGSSTMVAHTEVIKHPVNVATSPLKTFDWLQLLQRGDLSLFLCEFGGGNVSAISVYYAMIQVRPDGSRKRVGPQNRIPAKGKVGEYYATGLAGEGGQPGNWLIEWRYQVSSGDPVHVVEQTFCVQDAVMRANPRSKLDRKIKFGWN